MSKEEAMMVRSSIRFAILSLLCAAVASSLVRAEGVEGLLDSLTKVKTFAAARQSSYDPTEGNNDGRQDLPIAPSETRQMARIEGPGAIMHIWVTISSPDPNHLRNLVLRMYWDGETTPSVESPIGDFFGLGHAKYYQFSSLPIQIGTSNGLNCFWKMPFATGAMVTITNEGSQPVQAFYYYVDYQQYGSLPPDTARFHAHYRQAFPCEPGKNYTILDAQGKGHYVGCNLSIHNRADGWWGEGDDMIFIDDEPFPRFHGTGSEDYFCGAWCYGSAFSNLYFGCPLRGEHAVNGLWNVYRFHIEDPIPFEKSIRVTIEHGHNNDRSDDFSSVAYWYQLPPHTPFSPLPNAEERLPKDRVLFKEEGALEAEDLASQWQGGEVVIQDMNYPSDMWSAAKQLLFKTAGPVTYTNLFTGDAAVAGTFQLDVWHTAAADYGVCELWLNGVKIAEWDGYNESGVVRKRVTIPTVTVASGENRLEVRVIGKNETSTGFLAGMDCFKLSPVAAPAPTPPEQAPPPAPASIEPVVSPPPTTPAQ